MPNEPRRWMLVPDAGRLYYGLCKNAAYDAAGRGDIPTVRVGRLLRVPIHKMEEKFGDAGAVAPRKHRVK
jgi:hypothetical protein